MEKVEKAKVPKKVAYLTTRLACLHCGSEWDVKDLNLERKFVICFSCGKPNDIIRSQKVREVHA